MDYEEYEYQAFRHEIDLHNRCCAGRLWCIRDICGIICVILTWFLIMYAEFVVMCVMLLPSPYPIYSIVNMIIFNMGSFLAIASHIRTMCTDPVHIFFHSFYFVRSLSLIVDFLRGLFRKAMLRKI